MNTYIENIPQCRVLYLRQVGPYGNDNKEIMEQLKKWASDNNLLTKTNVILGIAQDNPQITKSSECRYDVCIIISNDYKNSGELEEITITSGKYLVFEVVHTALEMQKAWTEIFIKLQKQEQNFDDKRPIIERYKAEMVANHYCEILVPIK